MRFQKDLDERLKAEALALVGLSLGDHDDFEYVRIAKVLCEFRNGEPRAKFVIAGDPRSLAFLRDLQIVKRKRAESGGIEHLLNLKVNADPNRPLLMWDWIAK